MIFAQIGACVGAFLIIITLYFLFVRNQGRRVSVFLKALSLSLALVFFMRFMFGHDALRDVFALEGLNIGKFFTAVSIVLNNNIYACILLVVLYPFFKRDRYSFLIKYYSSAVTILAIAFISPVTKGICGADVYGGLSLRAELMGVELGILAAYSVITFAECGFKVKKSELTGLYLIPLMMLATMAPYVLKALFGDFPHAYGPEDMSLTHRIDLYIGVLLPILLFVALNNNKDKEEVRGILLYISIGTWLSFSTDYKIIDFADVTRLPLHLCHTAMYLVPLCLIFKLDKLFYFTYFINVFGALLAMLMPNYGSGNNIFAFDVVLFFTNHYIAFFMPILMVALRIYERPKLKHFTYSLVGFAIYYAVALISNAWLSNYKEVDYFFINSNFVADKLGEWANKLFYGNVSFNIGELQFTFHPLYQFLYFVVYAFIAAGMWFLYEAAYSFVDAIFEIQDRKKKIKADFLAREVNDGGYIGADMEQREIKLVLNDFSKRYGNGKVYAVKDASLEVNGGEIFGFLGHNGAGKSTIIKSIVGIQPITSGHITVCGYDVEYEPVLAKANIGYVPDHYALYEKLTGRQYVNYIADLYGISKEERNTTIEKYVKLFELQGAFDNQIKTYSHGMKQKITIISALVHSPKVWILDEPLTGLDPTSIYQVKECMKQHAEAGNIVFFSSHLIDVVESVCTRVAIIKKGHILDVSDLSEIKKNGTLEQYYLDRTATDVHHAEYKAEKAQA